VTQGPVPQGPVVVIGDLITDTIVSALTDRVDDADTPSVIVRTPGGQGANQAAWLAHAGARTALVARVGAADSAEQSARLRSLGIDAHLSADEDHPTGEIVVIVDHATSSRHMYTQRGASARLRAEDIPEHLVRGAAWVHVSGYALSGANGPAVMARAAELAGRHGAPLSLDPASVTEIRRLGADAFLPAGLAAIFPNRDELAALTGTDLGTTADWSAADDEEAADLDARLQHALDLLSVRAGVVVAKLGPQGATCAWRADGESFEVLTVGGRQVEVVDPTGAGDAFVAGWIAACLRGEGPLQCVNAAQLLAAEAISRLGAQPAR
jgi:sugar/nucleoside kinase (ribokinase family)